MLASPFLVRPEPYPLPLEPNLQPHILQNVPFILSHALQLSHGKPPSVGHPVTAALLWTALQDSVLVNDLTLHGVLTGV
jgi:hypothetical protein